MKQSWTSQLFVPALEASGFQLAAPVLRAVDVVRLIGAGMCFGGAIVAFIAYRRAGVSPK